MKNEKEKDHRIEHEQVQVLRDEKNKIAIIIKRAVRIDLQTNAPVEYAYIRHPSRSWHFITKDDRLVPFSREEYVADEPNDTLILTGGPDGAAMAALWDTSTAVVQAMLQEDWSDVKEQRRQRGGNQPKKTGKTDRKKNHNRPSAQ